MIIAFRQFFCYDTALRGGLFSINELCYFFEVGLNCEHFYNIVHTYISMMTAVLV